VGHLLLRQHVSALALGHHQVPNCATEETIQCSIRIAHIIQRDLVDNVTMTIVRRSWYEYYKIKIVSYIRREYSVSEVGVVMD